MPTVAALGLLVGALGFAVARPRRLPEAAVAVPAAVLAVLVGLVPWNAALTELRAMAPTVGFLAAVLVLARFAVDWGVFAYVGSLAAKVGQGDPRRLLIVVFANAAIVTAVLSLDATVVLLTPVVLATSGRTRPHLYACAHLANSASLLLPISNLTNLLAFAASGLSFGRFAALMALPWLAVILVEYAIFRRFFAADLARPTTATNAQELRPPRFVLVVLVVALGVLVLAVRRQGLDDVVEALVPHGTSLLAMLAVAALAAVLANLVNNLPATLVLLPAVSHAPALVLAMLIGVNVGPNLTYAGSLATLLWRRILHATDSRPAASEFLRLGALTVPAALLAGVLALWLGLRVFG